MINDLSHLQDCELVKYSLQLHIYKHILEKHTGFEVSKLHIIWFPEDKNYEIINPLCLEDEAKMLLNKEILFNENVS